MSHFAVLVIGSADKVDEQLAPYHEFECTGLNDQYVKDIDITEKVKEYRDKSGEFNLQEELAHEGLDDRTVENEENIHIEDAHKYGYAVVKDGKLIKAVRRTNPNAKWDWYSVGGRWNGFFNLKDGGQADQAKKKDIDFKFGYATEYKLAQELYRNMKEVVGDAIDTYKTSESIRESEEYKNNIEGARKAYQSQEAVKRVQEYSMREDCPMLFLYEPDILLISEEEYADKVAKSRSVTYVVVKDGKWYQQGDMGWWGISSNNKPDDVWQEEFCKFIESIPDDETLTIVDCHI